MLDHVFAAIVIVGLPIQAAWVATRLARELQTGRPVARLRRYRNTIVKQWVLVAALMVHWTLTARPLDALGLAVPSGWPLAVTVAAIAGVVTLFIRQMKAVAASTDLQARVREQLDKLLAARMLIPRTEREARWFVPVAVTAGICEEILYRGFLWWYLTMVLALGWPAAAVAAVTAFGVAHAYQGRRGIIVTGLVGAVALGLFLATGSLLAPIVLHTTIDWSNGVTARSALVGQT